jgi:hypothetical protein
MRVIIHFFLFIPFTPFSVNGPYEPHVPIILCHVNWNMNGCNLCRGGGLGGTSTHTFTFLSEARSLGSQIKPKKC